MIISKYFLSSFIDVSEISTKSIVEKLNSIGLEVDGVSNVCIPSRVVVGFVVDKQKHENSDKLSVCMVDVGEKNGGILQIVCGAKNVDKNQFVPVALEGAKIGEITIKPTSLRGVESNGMICSSSELGLPKINEGIMILDESIGKLEIGKSLNEYDFFNDDLIEIDITANRGDCLSLNGVARDLAAGFGVNLKEQKPYIDAENTLGVGRALSLHVDESVEGSFVYKVIEIKDGFSLNLKTMLRLSYIDKLDKCSIKSLLNYATYATGVLFRVYDFKKLSNDEKIALNIKKLENGEYAVKYKDDILSVAGITQNDIASVDENSKLIILEANYTHPNIIANAHQNYKNKDIYASFRGSEPRLLLGVDYLCSLINEKEAMVYTGVQQYSKEVEPMIISFTSSDISKCIGMQVEKNDIVKILKSLNFEITVNNELINIKPPKYRHDILNTHDICEEIVRIIGIDNIPSKPLIFAEQNRENKCLEDYYKVKDIRRKAVFSGYFESVHYVMDSEDDLRLLDFKIPNIKLLNPITAELNTLRSTLLSHLIKAASNNFKNFKRSVKLFECGSVFDENVVEKTHFAMICSGYYDMPNIKNHAKPVIVDFYLFLQNLRNIIGEFELVKSNLTFLSPFEQAFIVKDGEQIGSIGRLHAKIENHFDLMKTYVCEIDIEKIKIHKKVAKAYFNTPGMSRDLSIIAPKDLGYKTIKQAISELDIEILKDFMLVDIYGDEKLGDNLSLTINFTFQDSKTLEDNVVNDAISKILQMLEDKFGVGIRK